MGHPVDFGCPALSQGLVEFLTELLQRLVVRFTQSERVLRRRDNRVSCDAEVLKAVANKMITIKTT